MLHFDTKLPLILFLTSPMPIRSYYYKKDVERSYPAHTFWGHIDHQSDQIPLYFTYIVWSNPYHFILHIQKRNPKHGKISVVLVSSIEYSKQFMFATGRYKEGILYSLVVTIFEIICYKSRWYTLTYRELSQAYG